MVEETKCSTEHDYASVVVKTEVERGPTTENGVVSHEVVKHSSRLFCRKCGDQKRGPGQPDDSTAAVLD